MEWSLSKLQVAPHTGRESERVRHASLLRCWEWNRTEGGLNAGRVRFQPRWDNGSLGACWWRARGLRSVRLMVLHGFNNLSLSLLGMQELYREQVCDAVASCTSRMNDQQPDVRCYWRRCAARQKGWQRRSCSSGSASQPKAHPAATKLIQKVGAFKLTRTHADDAKCLMHSACVVGSW